MSKNVYFQRYAFENLGSANHITECPDAIIVIPSYKEEYTTSTLNSLHEAHNFLNGGQDVLVIIIINHPAGSDSEIIDRSRKTQQEVSDWLVNNSSGFRVIHHLVELPKKKAGVGLARKIGMDEACRVYEKFERDGVIINLDADCAVSPNYLCSIFEHFQSTKSNGANLFFEHPIQSDDHTAIIQYELHLRYFINAQRYCRLPCAYQTIGSSMAVRSGAYQKQGGMNTRKAGEDFYFIQKILLLGQYHEINDCTVYPSIRTSDRVPFGTGRAMKEWEEEAKNMLTSYNPMSFELIHIFVNNLESFYTGNNLQVIAPKPVYQYFEEQDSIQTIEKLKRNAASLKGFYKQFFNWFDGFQLMKLLHYLRDHNYPNQPIGDCVKWLLNQYTNQEYLGAPNLKSLKQLRDFDRINKYKSILDKVK